ncbi:MAG: hypothetical protein K6356_00070 [Chloroflexus sp.]
MHPFPAVMIGGPPHSGKSVLTYLLSQRLRQKNIEHYVLRACPDGEGDWSQESHPETVRILRQKGAFDKEFVDQVCRDIENRHLPLLVDVGGRPTPDQERIFRHCTHAILIAATAEGLAEWRGVAARAGLEVIAELHSVLHGEDRLETEEPVLRGQISGLERHTGVGGPMVDALVKRLESFMFFSDEELHNYLFPLAPVKPVIAIKQLAHSIGIEPGGRWREADLPQVLTLLPSTGVSIYGRGPNWLYAALALHIAPQPIVLFDPRLGWVHPTIVQCSSQPTALGWNIQPQPAATWLKVNLAPGYLDYATFSHIAAPVLAPHQGVIISGKLPFWLMVGLVLAYRHHPWLAVMQAQNYNRAIVVASGSADYVPGQELPVAMATV